MESINGELSYFGHFGNGFEWMIKCPDGTHSQYRTDINGFNLYVLKNGIYWRYQNNGTFTLPHNERVARLKVARLFSITDPNAPEIPAGTPIKEKIINSHLLRSKKYNKPID